jgi:hypothetical protein
MVDSRKEQPVANEHFKAHGYTVPDEILALVASGEAVDHSWHNDAAPCYGVVLNEDISVVIWVDHTDPKEREVEDRRFSVSCYNFEFHALALPNEGFIIATDDASLAIKAWRETVADIKAKLAALPKKCEGCGVDLNKDLTCPKCGVAHTAAPCATCGRVGLHKDDCTEPPNHDTEGGPAYIAPEERRAAVVELAKTFDRAYQYYNGWGFEYAHPGLFRYYQLGGDISVYFTPDYDSYGVVPVQVIGDDGNVVDDCGDHEFKGDRSAPTLFRIVKPYLDKLTGKSAKDFVR